MPAWPPHYVADQRRTSRQGFQPGVILRALFITGPTASGKSELAVSVAESVGGEIINADSRQIYRHMPVGTGWPPPAAFRRVPHHGYGIINPNERYNAAQFVNDARQWMQAIERRGKVAIVVGGTGFYIAALAGRMLLNRPPAGEELRDRLRREQAVHPPQVLHDWLASLSRADAAEIHRGDRYRTLRRLEGILSSRQANAGLTLQNNGSLSASSLEHVIVILDVALSVLRARIAARVQAMFGAGLAAEAEYVRTAFSGAPALTGVGYGEALAYRDGLATEPEAIGLTERHTLQYAKRQRTWFRGMRDVQYVAGEDVRAASAALDRIAKEFFAPA